jgi:hypothetical protein
LQKRLNEVNNTKRKFLLLVLSSFAVLILGVLFPMSGPKSLYPNIVWNATLFEPSVVIEGLQSLKIVLDVVLAGIGVTLGIYGIIVIIERHRRRRPPFYTHFDCPSWK